MTEPAVALVVAAGSGSRLGAPVPKAFVDVGGRTLVERSARALVAGGCGALVVVAPVELVERTQGLVQGLGVPVAVVAGGARRQDSVARGLDAVAALAPDAAYVLVHDAARAFVPTAQVHRVIDALAAGAVAVVPVLPVVDSIRRVESTGSPSTDVPDGVPGSTVVDRSDLVVVQTPQGFRLPELRAAHAEAAARGLEVTDDAAVCEAVGHPVALVDGTREAFKVTEPFDLVVARAMAAQEAAEDPEEQP